MRSRKGLRRPDPAEVLLRPRVGRSPRRLARLSERDAREWHRLAGRVAAAAEPRLEGAVVANRVAGSGPGWRVEGPEEATVRLPGALARLAGRPVLVATDVRAFYASVTPDVLVRALADGGAEPEDARLAADAVEGWSVLGAPGLPVGPPGSAVLANVLLRPVDAALGFPFVRWVDDYLIGLPGERAVGEALARLDAALEGAGLRRNEEKTRVLEPTGPLRAEALGWPGRSGRG